MTYKITTTTKTLKQLVADIKPDYQYFYPDFKDFEGKKETVELELVKINNIMTTEEVIAFMADKGLEPATFHQLASLVEQNPELFERWVATLKSDGEFVAFGRVDVERYVVCNRNGLKWNDRWWFAGRRKSLDTLPLELTINNIKYRKIS